MYIDGKRDAANKLVITLCEQWQAQQTVPPSLPQITAFLAGAIAMERQVYVARSIQNAIENGFVDNLENWTAEELANDIAAYDSGVEGVAVEDLIPLVQNWKDSRRATCVKLTK